MIGRFKRAQETNDALRELDRRAHRGRGGRRVRRGARARDHRRQRCRAAALRPRDRTRGARAAAGRVVGTPACAVPLPCGARPGAARAERRRCRRRPGRRAPAPPSRGAVGDRPLAGVRVLDFTAFWAGPAATAWLAAMGADVIKVESVQRPDGIRFSAAVRPSQDPRFYEMSALFHVVNLGKRGITLDLGHPDGLALAKQLVARSDVVVENFTPRVLEQFGLDYDVVRGIRPDVVMVRMPAFGLDRTVARPPGLRADDGADHRHGVGDRLRGRAADHPRRPGRPDGRGARRVGDRRRARAPRPHGRRAAGGGAAVRGRDRGDRRPGDQLRDRREAVRPAR